MGDLFENLIYRFAESANDGAGQFYTPRDVVRLLVDLVYAEDTEALRDRGTVRSIYDPTVGTGGMLTVADEHLHGLNPDASTALFGQEINPRTYAICKADLLIKGQDPSNVRQATRSSSPAPMDCCLTTCSPIRRSAPTGRPSSRT